MRLVLILFVFIISIYVFPAFYIIHHSYHHNHHLNADCETCMEIFSIVKTVSKIVKFHNIYNSVIIYLSVSCIFFLGTRKKIFYLNNSPIKLKVKLTN
ncbi:hypothetical protein BHAMNSH16_12080 [Brachyspira hampsonii]|uniref:Uncharacterized protein n=1 Tax=Brachyspira hampsonii TaxID=1287055 RepID=A0AAC9TWL6_9SPIR|nr:hypothetical protein [Brachyspira hampsonii]ASJ22337.1 hypothetical protein BHAMNSH16_12080 [Brachyspira hampsonii]OEJ19194.1 hypothetical protein A9496_04775 [Brachyspira hampsonii]